VPNLATAHSARDPARSSSGNRAGSLARGQSRAGRPRVAVLGDLAVDVVLAPGQALARGTDVPGRVMFRAGGSAANTARWLGRLGADVSLIAAVGRDPAARALEAVLRVDGVRPRLVRVAGQRTARIGVLVTPGERSFVADRGAADWLRPADLRTAWLRGAELLHLPAYSLLVDPLREAARGAIEQARAGGALISLDLASSRPLLARGHAAALGIVRGVAPDVLLATDGEAAALLGAAGHPDDETWLDELAGVAPVVVVKRGARGATALAIGIDGRILRVDVATRPLAAADTTGAGDAFDAGFLRAYLSAAGDAAARSPDTTPRLRRALRQSLRAGDAAARRQLASAQRELPLLSAGRPVPLHR